MRESPRYKHGDAFRNEVRKMLPEMDDFLRQLQPDVLDLEPLERVIRGVHTIRVAGLMYDFPLVSRLAGDMESVLDAVFVGKCYLTIELVATCREGLILLRQLMESTGRENLTVSLGDYTKRLKASVGGGDPPGGVTVNPSDRRRKN